MSRLHDSLIEHYAEHYENVNVYTDPTALSRRDDRNMQLRYGAFIKDLPPGSRVLDLGCGTGFILYWLSQQPGIEPVGVDRSTSQVDFAREKLPNIEIVCDDGLHYLREHPETFAGIFCNDVLEHIPDDDLLDWVEAAVAALQPGGFFFCRVPNAANITASHARYMDLTHERLFTSTSLRQLIELVGLHDCRIVPIRSAHLAGRIRLTLEHLLHRAIFRLVGSGLERVFTTNVCAVGFRKT
jgi:SAM-dependent methyltransferase